MTTINVNVRNINKSINLQITCPHVISIHDLKELIAKRINEYAIFFILIGKKNQRLDANRDALLTDLNIQNDDTLYIVVKLNKEKAVLEEWFRQDHNWTRHNNWCSDLPLSKWYGVTTNSEGKIIRLNLNLNRISVVAKELSQLKNLTHLFLSFNKISVVPKELSQLTNLTWLDLYNNNISVLPKELFQLTNLTHLTLSDNNISIVPKELSQLTKLSHLYLNNNKISVLPKELSQLTNLTRLYLYKNNISVVPKELSQLTNLTHLILSYNNISEIPKEFSQLPNLKILY